MIARGKQFTNPNSKFTHVAKKENPKFGNQPQPSTPNPVKKKGEKNVSHRGHDKTIGMTLE